MKWKNKILIFFFLSITCITLFVDFTPVYAQRSESITDYPTKPITLVVHVSAGGTTDLSVRKLADLMEKDLGQPIVVENRTGGGGIIGISAVARAKPDGYTIGTVSHSSVTVTPHMRKVPMDPKEDITYIAQYANYIYAFGVRNEDPWNTFKEFIDFARNKPGIATFGASGTTHQIVIKQIELIEKVKITHVPFGGGNEAIAALYGGHVSACLAAEVTTPARAGKLKALFLSGNTRSSLLPNISSVRELYNIEVPSWLGIIGPKGLPVTIAKKLESVVSKAMKDPSFAETLKTLSMTAEYRNSEDFKKLMLHDYEVQGNIIKNFGIKEK